MISRIKRLTAKWVGWAVLLLAISAGLDAAAETWTEIRSPHFRVLTDASPGRAREVAHEFEQMRRIFVQRFGREDIEAGAPLTVFAARDVGTFRQLDPALWKLSGDRIAGNFYRGWERQFALIRLDTWGDANQTVVYYEYAHSILHANFRWLPLWLDEGLGEFYGYTRFERGRTLLGTPSLQFATLRSRSLLPVSKVLALTPSSPELNDENEVQLVYAQAWAMVHLMSVGPDMDNGRKLASFIGLLQTGTPQPEAFRKSFGDPAAFDQALQNYIRGFTLKALILPADAKDDAKSYSERKLSAGETAYEIGCFDIGAHDRAEGRTSLEEAVKLDPKFAPAHEELGFIDFDTGKDEEAQKEWTEAVGLDAKLPRAQFALLMTGLPTAIAKPPSGPQGNAGQLGPAQLNGLRVKLQEITEIAPRYAAPRAELAIVEWRLGQKQTAYKDALLAEKLEPNRAGYHLLTGRILLSGRQPAAAAGYARFVATRWTGPDHNEAVELLGHVPAENRGSEPVPSLALPDGTQAVRGTIKAVTCPAPDSKSSLKVLFQPESPAGAAPLTLTAASRWTTGFSDTLWWGEDHFSSCHHVAGLPALIAIKPGGEFVDLEIRDPLVLEGNGGQPSREMSEAKASGAASVAHSPSSSGASSAPFP